MHMPPLKLNRKIAIGAFSFILTLFMTGCSGVNASRSVSPLDFLLPGLVGNKPAPDSKPLPPKTAPGIEVAQVRRPVTSGL